MRSAVAGTGYVCRRHGRHFALVDSAGRLVAVFVYLRGLASVAHRLAPLSPDHASRLN